MKNVRGGIFAGFPGEAPGYKRPVRNVDAAPLATVAQIDAALARAKSLPLPPALPPRKPATRRPLSGIRRAKPKAPAPPRYTPTPIPFEHLFRGIEMRGLRPLVLAVAAAHRVAPADMLGTGRARQPSRSRQALWVELRALGWSLPEIGAVMNRDHTTVLYGIRAAVGRGYVAQHSAAAMPPCEVTDIGPVPPDVLPEIPDLEVPARRTA